MKRQRRVMVAMSGGVDSSVAAALVRDSGCETVGVTLKLWGGESDSGCCSVSDVDDARRVADHLGIDHHTFNFGDDFTTHVVGPYIAAHQAGLTPNPCIECNRHLKFDRLLQRAKALGFDAVATGHHARIVDDAGVRRIARGADEAKDQSYVLAMLAQDELAHVELPVGDLTKDRVRDIASDLGLRTADKPDSQDVCFITSVSGRDGFLSSRIALTPAEVVDTDGNAVGSVQAIEMVTIGQRRGLNLAGGSAPRYVVDTDVANRLVTVGTRADLDVATSSISDVQWSAAPEWGEVLVQTRAHGAATAATIEPASDGRAVVAWQTPVDRVAPGQAVVFYRGDLVLGSGTAV